MRLTAKFTEIMYKYWKFIYTSPLVETGFQNVLMEKNWISQLKDVKIESPQPPQWRRKAE